jgi:hypothetical protein
MSNSWLFTRNDESVYISRADQFGVIVAGPGQTRQQFEFDSENAVEQYQRDVAEQMAAGGWILYAVDQQRRNRERASPGNSPDRRLRN